MSMRKKEITIQLPELTAKEFKKAGLDDSQFWVDVFNKGHANKGNVDVFFKER